LILWYKNRTGSGRAPFAGSLNLKSMSRKIVTIDGPAGSGKSTVSRLLAERLGVLYLDTGAMYRAVALQAKRLGMEPDEEKEIGRICRDLDIRFQDDGNGLRILLGDEDVSQAIRTPEMDLWASRVSALGEVRAAMVELQRKIGRAGSLVAEGRDMGTVVFPEADYKFFLTAPLEVRAWRRYKERLERGERVSEEEVLAELEKRDTWDRTRSIAPLRPAADAVIIDTSDWSAVEVVEQVLKNMEERGPCGS